MGAGPLLGNVSPPLGRLLLACPLVYALLPFVSLDQGISSGIADSREVIVQSERDWETLWKRHAPTGPPPPPVNFAKEQVIGVFAGQRPTAGYRVEITKVERESDGLTVVYRIESPPQDAIVAQQLTQPFHLVRLPALGLPIRFNKL
jgi:hypothetical protein